MAADHVAQERAGATPHPVPALSPGYVEVPAGMHPDHGEPCIFTPGELLPDWAVAALVEQRPEPGPDGRYRLTAVPTKPRSRR